MDVKIEDVIYDEGEVKQWSRTIIIGPIYRCGFDRGMIGEMWGGFGLEDVMLVIDNDVGARAFSLIIGIYLRELYAFLVGRLQFRI